MSCEKALPPLQVAVMVNVTSSSGETGTQNGAPGAGPRQTTLGPLVSVAVPNVPMDTVTLAGSAPVVIAVIFKSVPAVALKTSNVI